MEKSKVVAPEHTAVRVALWRALHGLIDAKPPVFFDEVGLKLVGDEQWRRRPDMDPEFSKAMRASVAGRARFVEDLVEERVSQGVLQYVILGAGLDSFAQRRTDLASRMQLFEVDQPGPQAWKQQRLADLAMPSPQGLHFVPVDFEAGQSWRDEIVRRGFDRQKPATIVSTGVSMYLSAEANFSLLQEVAQLAPASAFAMTFMLSLDLLGDQEKAVMEFVMKKANEAGTPFLSLFSPQVIQKMAKDAGFKTANYVSADDLYQRYFAKRSDGLNAGKAEAFLLASN